MVESKTYTGIDDDIIFLKSLGRKAKNRKPEQQKRKDDCFHKDIIIKKIISSYEQAIKKPSRLDGWLS
jgi:hypothetical protein